MEAYGEFELLRPKSLAEVLAARAAHPTSQLVGGGTDLVVNMRRGIASAPVLIDMNGVRELRTIKADAKGLVIGASVTLAELAQHAAVLKHYPVVAEAAASIAGPTHRNMGTLGGNLCLDTRCIFYNQSEWWRSANNHCLKTTGEMCHVAPKSRGVCFATFSGDLAPALLTLGAEVDLSGPQGTRSIPLDALYIGYARHDGSTAGDGKHFLSLQPGEFVTAVRVTATPKLRSGYDKIRIRRSIEYPVAGVAVAPAPRWRPASRPARGRHRHQPAPRTAGGDGQTVRRQARRRRAEGPRRPRPRPDHVDEDDVYARPLPPPHGRRAGPPARQPAV